MSRRLLPILALALLGACASGSESDLGDERAQAVAYLRGALAGRAEVPPPTRAALAARGTTGSVLVVSRPEPRVTDVLTPLSGNDGAITWGGGPVSVDLREGIVSGTRGLGFDLISAETAPLRAAMAAGGGRYTRALRDLDGEGRLRRLVLDCTLESQGASTALVLGQPYTGRRFRESCAVGPAGIFLPNAPGGRIVNEYALDGKGIMRSSRQWIAPRLGYLELGRTEIAGQ